VTGRRGVLRPLPLVLIGIDIAFARRRPIAALASPRSQSSRYAGDATTAAVR